MSSNNGQSTSDRSTSGEISAAERQARLDSAYKALTGEDASASGSQAPTTGSSNIPSYYFGKYDDDNTNRNTTTTTGSGDISEAERKLQLDATMQTLTGDSTSRYSAGGETTRTPTQSVRSGASGETVPFKLSPKTAEELRRERGE